MKITFELNLFVIFVKLITVSYLIELHSHWFSGISSFTPLSPFHLDFVTLFLFKFSLIFVSIFLLVHLFTVYPTSTVLNLICNMFRDFAKRNFKQGMYCVIFVGYKLAIFLNNLFYRFICHKHGRGSRDGEIWNGE